MLSINFKDYFWEKFEDLHERYEPKKITTSNIIELFTRLQNSMSSFSKELNDLITKDYILFPEQSASKYDALEFLKLIITIQSTQLNIGVEIIKNKILDTIKMEKAEEIIEKELYNDLKKNIIKYEESKLNLNKAKDKFYQSTNIAEISIRQAIELSNKEKNKGNSNSINNTDISDISKNNNIVDNNELLAKMKQKSLDNLLEARKNDEKYIELIKEANNYREIINNKQSNLLKFYQNMEYKDHQLYISLLREYNNFLKTDNDTIKSNLMLLEEKIKKIDYNKDIIELINIYGSDKKPEKAIKYSPYEPEFDYRKTTDENELSLNFQVIMAMKPFIKDLYPNFNVELESKKQDIREMFKKIVNNDLALMNEDKNKLLSYINEDWGQNYFLYLLSKERSNGKFCYNSDKINFLAEIIQKILISAEKKLNYQIAKHCIILSQTYYYEEKEEKIYIMELISTNEWLKKEEFWRNIIDVMIKEDIEKTTNLNKNNEKVSSKMQEESINNIVFGQLISYIKNMKDFKIDNKIIVEIADVFMDKYKISKNLIKYIYDNIENEKEIEKIREENKNIKSNDN